jgi:hypothetical protein
MQLSASAKSALINLTCLIAGGVLSDVIAQLLTPKKCNLGCLIVLHTLTFPDQAALDAFKETWGKLADECFKNVPDCLSCELSDSTTSNLTCIVFERFKRSGHFQNKHDLLAVLGVERESSGIKYSQESYEESDLGFMERW